jgi:hypothetical protein
LYIARLPEKENHNGEEVWDSLLRGWLQPSSDSQLHPQP